MPESPELRPVPLRARRDETIQVLCAEFAQDNLTLAEFEKRLDQAHSAATMADLDVLIADLKPVPVADQTPTPQLGRPLPATQVRDSQTMVAIMGGVGRKGAWSPARHNNIIAFMGGAELDFREARMPPGVTELTIVCMMGGAQIVVPPGLTVESNGIAIMGGFEDIPFENAAAPDAPVLRINGFVLMGGVDISVREPGESARDARKRVRARRRGRPNE